MIETKDNFLDDVTFEKFVREFTSDKLQWFLQHNIVDDDGHIQMTHVIYDYKTPQSYMWNFVQPIVDQLNICSVIRIKANLLFRTEKIIEHGMHIDIPEAPSIAKTAVFYLNTNNGYTKFEDGTKVESVANRIAIFPNTLKHTGSTNICKTPYRLVLNLDYIESEDTYSVIYPNAPRLSDSVA